MAEQKFGESPSPAKKIWTKPAIKVIDLNSARNAPPHGAGDAQDASGLS